LPKESEAFTAWNGKQISDILNHESQQDLPFDVISASTNCQQEEFNEITDISLYFPRRHQGWFCRRALRITPNSY